MYPNKTLHRLHSLDDSHVGVRESGENVGLLNVCPTLADPFDISIAPVL